MEPKYIEAKITEYLHRKAAAMHTPINGTFELTPVCNMACRMCYVRMTKEQQEGIRPLHSADEWIDLASRLTEKGLLYLLLTGGEPLLHPEFRKIMEEIHKLGILISINSNGTLITDKVVEWMKKCPPTRINITMYGASNETYRKLCGNANGFTQVTNAIHLLKDAGISVKINCSLTPYNIHDLDEIKAFCDREELILQPVSYMFPPARRDESMIGQNDRFTPEEAAWNAAKIEYLSNGKERFLEHVKNSDYSGFEDTADDCSGIEGDGIRCRAGKSTFWITWDGRMLPCGMFPGDRGANIFETSFDEAWMKLGKEVDAIRLPAECAVCKSKDSCRACAAMVITETGNFHTVPKYRCDMMHAYPAAVQKLVRQLKEEHV